MRLAIFAPKYSDVVAAAVREAFAGDLVVCKNVRACTDALGSADILFINGALYDDPVAEAVRRSPTLRWIQFLSSGTDAVARHGGLPAQVMLTNAAPAFGPIVAEHAMALALALVRAIPALEGAKCKSAWAHDAVAGKLSSFDGACVVILGFGAIGREIAARATAFGADCIAVRRRRVADEATMPGVTFAELDASLPRADILFVAIPLTAETKALIDRRRLALLRPHAKLINVARSAVVDTNALIEALRNGSIESAALDVFDDEPLPPASELWRLPNLVISPHIAGRGSPRVAERMIALCLRNLRRFHAGTLQVAADVG
ncbi:MAG: D-2-hydroxyacid dehydrogenase [Casimicrobiaceae bacterium]